MPGGNDTLKSGGASSLKAYLFALSATLLWSTVATAFKLALRGFTPIQLLFYSSLSSLLIFLVLSLIRYGNPFKGVSRRAALISAVAGFLNPFLYYLVLFKAYSLLPAQEAQPLNYTWPIALSLISIPVLRQMPGPKVFLGLILSFSGVMLISTRGDILSFRLSSPLGDSLALGSGLIWASYWLVNLKRGGDILRNLTLNFSFGFPMVALLALLRGEIGARPVGSLIASAYTGLFEMGVTFLLWNYGLSLADQVARVSNVAYLSPFISLLFIRFVLGERLRWSSVAGLTLIVAGILISAWRRR